LEPVNYTIIIYLLRFSAGKRVFFAQKQFTAGRAQAPEESYFPDFQIVVHK
jgi:hypothetical protein